MTELADIFRRHGPAYLGKYSARILPSHRQAMQAIEQCRTAILGGHVYSCSTCDEVQYRYHSCRNRHCPKCQGDRGQEWLEKQQDFLLPRPYFLLTFTLPQGLRKVVRGHQKLLYSLLFRAAAEAMQKLAQDPHFVGGKLGMVGVLHTWGRKLSFHPHVHFLVPAGGLAADGQTWLDCRKTFLLPVRALSLIFRAKFRDGLRNANCFSEVPAEVWRKPWVVHCKPVGDGRFALQYLAPYIFRVAISNHRILGMQDNKVTFRFRDTESGKFKTCTLKAEEFIRRFLQHVLPRGFVKVRYYGFFSPGKRQQLAAIRAQLDGTHAPIQLLAAEPREEPDPDDATPKPSLLCPACGQAMRHYQTLPRSTSRPP